MQIHAGDRVIYKGGNDKSMLILGQFYVGTGYRAMSQALHRVLDTVLIEVVDPPTTYPY